jgi:hypothetical protein
MLSDFYKAFSLTSCSVYDDCIVYKTPAGSSDKVAVDANNLIKSLNLPLIAKSTSFTSKDSICVQKIKEVE